MKDAEAAVLENCRANPHAGYRRRVSAAIDEAMGTADFLPNIERGITISAVMSREVTVEGRRFYIVSEPQNDEWRAQVLELLDDKGSTHDMGIETTGETRGLADERALGVLQHRLRPSV